MYLTQWILLRDSQLLFSPHKACNCAGLIPAPELLEEDIASEAELDSDEETALQWLSEPLPDFGRHLSGFGQLFTLLEGMVTERSSQLLRGHGHGHAQSTEVPQHSSLQVKFMLFPCCCAPHCEIALSGNSGARGRRMLHLESPCHCAFYCSCSSWGLLQGQAVLEGGIERVLGDVMKAMHVPALRSAVEQHLHSLAGTFHFAAAIPNLQVCHSQQHCSSNSEHLLFGLSGVMVKKPYQHV